MQLITVNSKNLCSYVMSWTAMWLKWWPNHEEWPGSRQKVLWIESIPSLWTLICCFRWSALRAQRQEQSHGGGWRETGFLLLPSSWKTQTTPRKPLQRSLACRCCKVAVVWWLTAGRVLENMIQCLWSLNKPVCTWTEMFRCEEVVLRQEIKAHCLKFSRNSGCLWKMFPVSLKPVCFPDSLRQRPTIQGGVLPER